MADKNPNGPKHKRIVMCMGPYCNANQRAERNGEILKPILQEINEGDIPLSVTLEFSTCMNMCGASPNWIIYPEGEICHHVDDEEEIRRIVDEHLRD